MSEISNLNPDIEKAEDKKKVTHLTERWANQGITNEVIRKASDNNTISPLESKILLLAEGGKGLVEIAKHLDAETPGSQIEKKIFAAIKKIKTSGLTLYRVKKAEKIESVISKDTEAESINVLDTYKTRDISADAGTDNKARIYSNIEKLGITADDVKGAFESNNRERPYHFATLMLAVQKENLEKIAELLKIPKMVGANTAEAAAASYADAAITKVIKYKKQPPKK